MRGQLEILLHVPHTYIYTHTYILTSQHFSSLVFLPRLTHLHWRFSLMYPAHTSTQTHAHLHTYLTTFLIFCVFTAFDAPPYSVFMQK